MRLIPHANRNITPNSSARDQLIGQPVAVKKIMKPFSTPVLAKRTYRELKLLKHLRHENVCFLFYYPSPLALVGIDSTNQHTADYQLE